MKNHVGIHDDDVLALTVFQSVVQVAAFEIVRGRLVAWCDGGSVTAFRNRTPIVRLQRRLFSARLARRRPVPEYEIGPRDSPWLIPRELPPAGSLEAPCYKGRGSPRLDSYWGHRYLVGRSWDGRLGGMTVSMALKMEQNQYTNSQPRSTNSQGEVTV